MRISRVMQFIIRQLKNIKQGVSALLHKNLKSLIAKISRIPFYLLAIPAVLIIRLISPWLLVRLGRLRSERIGHFVANTEMYLCEHDAGINVPIRQHIDIFYFDGSICNRQLSIMWKRVLYIWPARIVAPIYLINRLVPGGDLHMICNNSCEDRDVHNLLDRFPPHLEFTDEEEARGVAGLQGMGLPVGRQFVCLNVRDSAYLAGAGWAYHNYRNSNVKNYVLAAEELVERGYFVIRMGIKVHAAINCVHPKVIDYATNGMRSDFMDIYLGAKCAFCLSTGTGWDAVPENFRRPVVFVNFLALGGLHTYRSVFLSVTKKHVWKNSSVPLSLQEIFFHRVGFCVRESEYKSKGVELIENTPEEIRDVAIEMAERLAGTWQALPADEALQLRFWSIFLANAVDANEGKPLHGEIRARFGATFLRNNPAWLQ